EDAKDSDIIVVTSGAARKPGQTRIDLTQGNVNIIKSFMPKLAKIAPNAIYVIVSNPVDIITYTILKCTELKEHQVIGTGTSLDSGRLRSIIAEKVNLNPKNVHAYVFGEHGDSSMVPWSTTAVAGMQLDTYCKAVGISFDDAEKAEVEETMKKSGAKVIACKGATNFAIAQVAANVCRCVLRDNDAVLTVSTPLHGQYGINDICISLPCVVGASGIKRMIAPELTKEETERVISSAKALEEVINSIEI
ncbi:MAG: L-lactate dehydrogenase, partial [Oscillospiraceae bacterium]